MLKPVELFMKQLECEKESCLKEAVMLARDNRHDESVMVKVRANVFDIFIAVSQTAGKQFPQTDIAVQFINDRVNDIPDVWRKSLILAEANGDYVKAENERIKLEAMDEIKSIFQSIIKEAVDND